MTQPSGRNANPLHGIAHLGSGEILARAVAFLGTVVLARRLGTEAFGIVGFATALVGYLALGVNVGLADVGAREVAAQPQRAAGVYFAVLRVRLALAAAAAMGLVLVVALLPKPPDVRLVVLLSGLSFLSLALDPLWVYRALERTGIAAAGQVLAQSLYVLGVLWLVSTPSDVPRVPLAQAGAELAAAALFAAPIVRWRGDGADRRLGRRLLGEAGFVTVSRVARTIIISFDVVFLGFTAAPSAVGLYTASYRLCFLVMAIAGTVRVAYLPSFARAHQLSGKAMESLLTESLQMSMFVGAPLVVGGIVTARPMLAFLFGSDYAPAAPALALLLLAMAFRFIGVVLVNVFLVTRRTGLQAGVYTIACVLNVGLNFWAIPRYGIVGAAATTALAEATSVVAELVAIRGSIGVSPRLIQLGVPVGLAAVMGAVVWSAGSLVGLPAQVVLGSCTYGLLVVAWTRWKGLRFTVPR